MNTNHASKIKCLFFIVIMLLNPILVSADALLSDLNSSGFISTIDSSSEMPASCHEKNMLNSQQEAVNNAECCDAPCECGASGCNAPSATMSMNKTPFFISTYSLNYLRDHYLSFISTPSFPPPIV